MPRHIRKFAKIRVLTFVFALAMIFFALTFTPSLRRNARADGDETHITYYTDSTYTTQCGYTIILCMGYRAHNGCTTAYYTVSYVPCQCDEINPC